MRVYGFSLLLLLGLLSSPGSAHGEPGSSPAVVCLKELVRYELNGKGSQAKQIHENTYLVNSSGEDAERLRYFVIGRYHEVEPKSATVEVRDKTGVRVSKMLSDFSENPYLRDQGFVSDSKLYTLQIPHLEPGDTVVFREEYKNKPFLGFPIHLFGSQAMPHKESIYEVVIPRNLAPQYRVFNKAGNPEETTKDKKIVWKWHLTGLDFPGEEEFGPPDEDLLPAVSIGVNRIAWGPADSWKNIGQSYLGKIKDRLDQTITFPPVDSNAGSQASIAGECLSWVQTRMRYVSISLGPGGKIPHKVEEIHRRQFGDCKDMSALLLSFLGQENVTGYMALVNTRPPAGQNIDPLPTLQYFNHAVVCAGNEDSEWWLDATDSHGTLKSPRIDIQGAPALVITGPHAGFRRIPLNSPSVNTLRRSVRLTGGQDEPWFADIRIILTGVRAQFLSRRLQSGDKPDQIRNLIKESTGLVSKADNNGLSLEEVSPDSILITGRLSIPNPLKYNGQGLTWTPTWEPSPYPLSLIKTRTRTANFYFPFVAKTVDSLFVGTGNWVFMNFPDSTWESTVPGLEVSITQKQFPGYALLVRTTQATNPVMPSEYWSTARQNRRRLMRWSSRTLLIAPR